MKFELTEALIEDIAFAMENQAGEYLLDTREGIVLWAEDADYPEEEIEADEEHRFIGLPDWEPQDGYRLMEHFTAGLKNPVAREELTAALNRGKGVFRAFKDVIGQYPEVEKLWFKYKDKGIKDAVIYWYNALVETSNMEKIGHEPEDTSALLQEDFRIRAGNETDRFKAEALHKLCVEAIKGDTAQAADRRVFESMNKWIFPGSLCFIAENNSGDFAGYISSHSNGSSVLHICVLEVAPEYRGLGLGKALLGRLLEQASRDGINSITIDLTSGTDFFSHSLLMENFAPSVQRYARKE
ncbi:MAG: GNAT family N-acetyltransferase [Treponema sp.]|nr:GNAT family N-acetyltransferase [Treponema sp.]